MSFNPNFYNNIPHNFTFQNFAPNIPPPPIPPSFIMLTTSPNMAKSDQDFVKKFEANLPTNIVKKHKIVSITEVKQSIRKLVTKLQQLKTKEKYLEENIHNPETWESSLNSVEELKLETNKCMDEINNSHLEDLRKQLAKRSAKRLRLRRRNLERNKEKEIWAKEMEERSRKIDENLNKIKDDIQRAKMEKEAKIQADIVLKEVLRKKNDAKKCITKLDALVKLRRARQNTAKGRGEVVLEKDADTFNGNIDKLKFLWQQKLTVYIKEESDLRAKLKQEVAEPSTLSSEKESEICSNLTKWSEFLFGGDLPQVDFAGDLSKFINVRSQWDLFVNEEGTSLPIGWVLPN